MACASSWGSRRAAPCPQSDGMVESFIWTVIDQLAKTLLGCEGEGDDHLAHVAFTYNTSPYASTGFMPYFLTHEREAREYADMLLPPRVSGTDRVSGWCTLVGRLKTALAGARMCGVEAYETKTTLSCSTSDGL